MKAKPWLGAYALAVLFRSVGRDLSRSLPPKEKPAKELPYEWRLMLMGAALRLLAADPDRVEPSFASGLTSSTKASEVCAEIGHNDEKLV